MKAILVPAGAVRVRRNGRALRVAAALAALALARASGQGFGFGEEPAQADASAAEAKAASPVELGGAIGYAARAYPDSGDLSASEADSVPSAKLTVSARGASISAFARLQLDPDTLESEPAAALAEAWASASIGPLEIKGGLQRISWGVADSLRVLDVVSPHDYRSFTFREAEDQYLPQATLSAKLALGERTSLQALWTPFFEGDRYATSGKWVTKKAAAALKNVKDGFYWGTSPTANGGLGDGLYFSFYSQAYATVYASALTSAMSALTPASATAEQITAAEQGAATAATTGVDSQLSSIQSAANTEAASMAASFMTYPDTATLKYSQVGARFTTSVGGLDLGAQYWYGFDRRPSYDKASALVSGLAAVSYDRLHHVGADAAFALGGINFRLEGAANLTGDSAGTDATVHNRSLAWAAGADASLLGFNVNAQGMQVYILDASGIASPYDVEYGANAFETTVALVVDRSFDRDRIKAQVAGIWEIEQGDYMLSPSLAFTVSDDAELRIGGRVFLGDEEGNFGQYAGNSYAELSIKYAF